MGLPEPIARREETEAAQTREFFDEYGRMVLVLCRALLRDRRDAEDAAQQTFLAAYRSLLAGQRPRHPAGWLATIARNECHARRGNGDDLSVALPLDVEAANGDPAEIAAARSELAALSAALAELPERQREVVRLHCLGGLTYDEVAESMHISSRAVDGLLVRARNRLRRRLRDLTPGALVVPETLRDRLAQLIPGFEQGSGAVAVAAGGGAGALTAAGSAPLTAKLAVATVGVAALGSAGVKPSPPLEPAAPVAAQHAPKAIATRPDSRPVRLSAATAVPEHQSRSGPGDERRLGSAGPGHSGRGSGESSSRGPGGSDRSGHSGEHGEDEPVALETSSSGPGPGSSSSGKSGSGSVSSSGSGTSSSRSSGSSSSGSGSSGSSSSGSGESGPGPPEEPD